MSDDLFSGPWAHSPGTTTEHAALAKASPHFKSIREHILAELEAAGEQGLTPDEFADKHGMLINTIRRRFVDLWKAGMICKSDATRVNSNGNDAVVWRLGRDPAIDTGAEEVAVAAELPFQIISCEEMARALDDHPSYRVLRRLVPPTSYWPEPIPPEERRIGCFVDVETTGKDRYRDRIIQLGLVRFEFTLDGRIGAIGPTLSMLEDPGMPIPAEITEITGITDEMVKGHSIPGDAIAHMQEGVSLYLAHNADFDRRMTERRFPGFDLMPWGCTQRDIRWAKDWNIRGQKLDYLLSVVGRAFHDGHDALADCFAAVHILAQAANGRAFFAHLLDAVRAPRYRLWAVGSPFEMKDTLKTRDYQWSDGKNGTPKAWYRDLWVSEKQAELDWYAANVPGTPALRRLSARDRWSVRSDVLPARDARTDFDPLDRDFDHQSGRGM